MPQDLIELLDQFNRKERFFLLCNTLGLDRFSLHGGFRKSLGSRLGVTIPSDARVWMDYHLDWLAAAVIKWHQHSESDVYPNGADLVRGSQQDLDLLIAFEEAGRYRLVLIEAKGYESWSNPQALQKVKRLESIFGKYGDKYPGLELRYCLMSPNPPERLKYAEWPDWMKPDGTPVWLKLPVPYPRLEVNRWDDVQKKESASGQHFRISESGS